MLPTKSTLSSIYILLLLTVSPPIFSQVVGGREPGETTPKKVEPQMLDEASFSNNVNTFDGTYNGSYTIGNISTSGGLAFNLKLNYSSSRTTGGTESIVKGIPYGEGWSLNIPRITVESNYYRQFTNEQIQQAKGTPNPHYQNMKVDIHEGRIYAHTIRVNIPGKINCTAIYKYTDKYGWHVFVPDAFDKHVSIRLNGSVWEVALDDGTVYTFRKAVKSYRAAANKRNIFDYNDTPTENEVGSQVVPKTEYISWYCSRMKNHNIPLQQIAFYYEDFGEFDFFKEFKRLSNIDQQYSNANWFGSVYNATDFKVAKDILLKKIVGYNQFGNSSWIELSYKTQERKSPMLDFTQPDVFRKDSLYNYKTVYNTDNNSFNNWKRYYHAAHSNHPVLGSQELTTANGLVNEINRTNPFARIKSNASGSYKSRYNRSLISTTANYLEFDHCFLESDRLIDQELWLPGELYEIQSTLSSAPGDFCNYDINIVSGQAGQGDSGNELLPISYESNGGAASERIFSTFNSAIKWNPAGANALGSNSIKTSNLFVMPNLPENFYGIILQFGPANSDHVFNVSERNVFNSSYLSAFSAYNKFAYNNVGYTNNVLRQAVPTYYDHIPQNFGIGMPWYMMSDNYSYLTLGAADKTNPSFRSWFKKTSDAITDYPDNEYPNISNQPTLAGNGATLSKVKLIRYSKNPYMLSEVKTYIASGEVSETSLDGFTLKKRVKLNYDIKQNFIADNKQYDSSSQISHKSIMQNHYVLSSIKFMPTDPTSLNPNYDTISTPNTYFNYKKIDPTRYSKSIKLIGSIWAMSKVTNELGLIKELKYYSLPDSMHHQFLYKMNKDEIRSYYGQSTHNKEQKTALEVRPIVKKVLTQLQGSNKRSKIYNYSWDKLATKKYGKDLVNSDFYIKSSGGNLGGFYQTIVYEASEDNERNYTIYTHFSGSDAGGVNDITAIKSKMGGKVKKIEKFNGNDQIISETIFEYKKALAYEGGFYRPDNDKRFWEFDYMDYYFEDTPGASLTELIARGGQNRVKFSNNVLYYDQEYNNNAANYKSYFINVSQKTERKFDQNSCILTPLSIEPSFNAPMGDNGNVEGSSTSENSYINTIDPNEQLELIELIDENENYEDVKNTLIENSPLSDSVLIRCLTKNSFQEQSIFLELLNTQENLSDRVLSILLTEPTLLINQVFYSYSSENEPEYSEPVLNLALKERNYIEHSLLETLFQIASPLSDSLLRKVLSTTEDLPHSSIEAIATNQDSLSEETRLALFEGSSLLSAERINRILNAHSPYPSDSVLKQHIRKNINSSPQTVIDFINASPGSHSPQVAALIHLNQNYIPTEKYNTFNENQISKPYGNLNCINYTLSEGTLIHEKVTEYTYYTAKHNGYSYSTAFKELLDLDQDSILLKFEPSWQLYSEKTYSPQNPEAFSEKRYYYYFDLKNRYDRHLENYKNRIDNNGITRLGQTLNLSNGEYERELSPSTIDLPKPDGMLAAYKNELRNIPFQETIISKNGTNSKPFIKSSYYLYTSRWPYDENFVSTSTRTIPPIDTLDCTIHECLDIHYIPSIEIFYDKETQELIFQDYGYYNEIYSYYDGGKEYFFYVDSRKDCVYAPETLLVRESAHDRQIINQPNPELANFINYDLLDLGVLFLKSTYEQIDTVETYRYKNSQKNQDYESIYGSTRLMNFENIGQVLPNPLDPSLDIIYDIDYYKPYFPYPTLKQYEVLSRNPLSLPTLIENENGLQTKFEYYKIETIVENVATCNFTWNRFVNYGNLNKPHKITTYPKNDTLNPHVYTYQYYPDLSIKKIKLPDNSEVEYRYNEYGQLKEERIAGKLIKAYKYNFWDGDNTKTFEERAADNYLETITFPTDSNSEASISRVFKDPLGREFQSARALLKHGINSTQVDKAQYSGRLTYNSKDQIIQQERAFEYSENSASPFELLPKIESNNLLVYPKVNKQLKYESGWQARLLEKSNFGESIGGSHNQTISYRTINSYCLSCNLGLSAFEINEIMPQGIDKPYLFYETTTIDEDGKSVSIYKNTEGQVVAKKKANQSTKFVTVFSYNNQGLKKKVINPKNQISNYNYNLLGWLYQKDTPDEGLIKMMYNKHGKVSWLQDELSLAGKKDQAGITTPFLKYFKYDTYGRLIEEGEAFYNNINSAPSTLLTPLMYYDTEFGDSINMDHNNPYFYHKFSNLSTLDWRSTVKVSKSNLNGGGTSTFSVDTTSFLNAVSQKFSNKMFVYDNFPSSSIGYQLAHNNLTAPLTRGNRNGKLSYSVTYSARQMISNRPVVDLTFYNYNSNGRINRLIKQFNPNGINSNSPGILTTQLYEEYNNLGNAKRHDIDVNGDGRLDMQFYKVFDYKGRTKEIYANSRKNLKNQGFKVASFKYDDVFDFIIEKQLHFTTLINNSPSYNLVDQVDYEYDIRNRLSNTQSSYFDYQLYYDNQQASLNGITPNGDLSYNGNINGIKANYKISPHITGQFTEPTVYNYSYDELNRLTNADGIVGDVVANTPSTSLKYNMGDANYTYDKIGNITNLQRTVSGNNEIQGWNFSFQSGTNKLNHAQGLSGTANRHYTYDVNGNLYSDNSREISSIQYNSKNLAEVMKRQLGGKEHTISYRYNADNQRIMKLFYETATNFFIFATSNEAQYYLHGANGKTIAMFDFNEAKWIWYVNHQQRIAAIRPHYSPTLYSIFDNWGDVTLSHGTSINDIKNALTTYMQSEEGESPGIEDLLLVNDLTAQEGTPSYFWTTQSQLDKDINFGTLIEGEFEVSYRSTIRSPKSAVLLKGNNGEHFLTSIEAIYLQEEYEKLPDSSNYWSNIIGNGDINLDDEEDDDVGFGTPIKIPTNYYRYDHLGNTRVVYTMDKNGFSINSAYDYFPYGKILRSYISGNGFERYLTTQHERDHETISENTGGTGFSYAGARYLDHDAPHFISVDPLADNFPSWSPYSYAFGNPVRFIDKDGRAPSMFNGGGEDEPNAKKLSANASAKWTTGKTGVKLNIAGVKFEISYSSGASSQEYSAEGALFDNSMMNAKGEHKQTTNKSGWDIVIGGYEFSTTEATETTSTISTLNGFQKKTESTKTNEASFLNYSNDGEKHKIETKIGGEINLGIIGVGAEAGFELTDPVD